MIAGSKAAGNVENSSNMSASVSVVALPTPAVRTAHRGSACVVGSSRWRDTGQSRSGILL